MKKEMTKAELIQAIGVKVQRTKPFIRDSWLNSLKYKTKPELKKIHRKVKADRDGYGITLI